MKHFYGFDLGDAESAIARLSEDNDTDAEILTVREARSFISACACLDNGEILIGEAACYNPSARTRKIRFKSRFLTDPAASRDIRTFAAGVLRQLRDSRQLPPEDDCCFYIGCPAGWDKNSRELYREIFEGIGYPPARIVSESRAALVSACQSRHLQVGYDILSKPVLVVDIGSSTTDFAYISDGHEVQLQTAGEVFLGGGIMDALLLRKNIEASSSCDALQEILADGSPWQSYCEFAARRLKEKYFSDEEYWKDNDCSSTVMVRQGKPIRLKMVMDEKMADTLLYQPCTELENRSFYEMFLSSLKTVREKIDGPTPELLFLTGGVSRLPAVREWCREAFPESVVVTGAEPEFSVARGLARCGRIDQRIRLFRREVQDLIASPVVEQIVSERILSLYQSVTDALVQPMLEQAALPVFDLWRQGKIRRLCDVNEVLTQEISAWLKTENARSLMIRPVSEWLKGAASALEEYTMPICIRHGVPCAALNLSSYLSVSDLRINVDAGNVFAVDEITWMIDAVITVLVSLLCGGSGIALISGGLPGLAAGAVLSVMVLLIGRNTMQKALLKTDIPAPIRKLIPEKHFRSRLSAASDEIRTGLLQDLETDKNEKITGRMAGEISQQIESCLTRMAEIVEIPLA